MKKIILSIFTITVFGFGANAQDVTIPDANFKAYLVGNTAINTNADTEIQVSEANAFTGAISCNYLSIADMTGIEAFTSISQLNCIYNSLTSLSLTQNTALTHVNCGNNSLTTLDVSQCTDLISLTCKGNSLTTIDLSQNTALVTLNCYNNTLTGLNVSQNTLLGTLSCYNNSISSLDVSQNNDLSSLRCYNNSLTTLITQNPDLELLFCYDNSLTALDLSQNPSLTTLRCYGNSIDSLDLTQNIDLDYIQCQNNQLTSLNVANGYNISFSGFDATNNPNLTCIQVDDVSYSSANWTDIDAIASFSLNCNPSVLVSSIVVQGEGGASTITTVSGTLQMEATVLPANSDDLTYGWSVVDGTGSATISSNGLLTAVSDGTVTVTATANDASGITGDIIITISNQTAGLADFESKKIVVFPNPVKDQLKIENENLKINSISIINITGKTVKTFTSSNNIIDVSDLAKGIYFLQIQTDKGLVSKKIIKE